MFCVGCFTSNINKVVMRRVLQFRCNRVGNTIFVLSTVNLLLLNSNKKFKYLLYLVKKYTQKGIKNRNNNFQVGHLDIKIKICL